MALTLEEEPIGVAEQRMGSESVSEKQSCSEEAQAVLDCNVDLTSTADMCVGNCTDDNAGCVSGTEATELNNVEKEGLTSGREGVSVPEVEDFLNSECVSNGCGEQNDVDGGMELKEGDLCCENGVPGSVADCEVLLETGPSAQSPENGIRGDEWEDKSGNGTQLDEHRDDESENAIQLEECRVDESENSIHIDEHRVNEAGSVVQLDELRDNDSGNNIQLDDSRVDESGNAIQLEERRVDEGANCLSSEGMVEVIEEQDELPLEFVDVHVCRDYNKLSANSLVAPFEKSIVLTGVEGGGSRKVLSPVRDGQMISEVSETDEVVSNCNGDNEKGDDDGACGVSDRTKLFEAFDQKPASPSIQRSLDEFQMSNLPNNFGQQRDLKSNNSAVDDSLVDRATEFMEEKNNVMSGNYAEIHTQRSPAEDNLSSLKENPSNVAPNCIIESNVHPQSCDTFSIANNSVGGPYADTVEDVGMNNNVVDACNQTLSPDLLVVCTQETDQSIGKVKDCVEQNADGMTDMMVDTGTQILLKEENASSLTEGSAGVVPNGADKSVSLQQHQSFGIVSNESFKTVNAPHVDDFPGHVESGTSFEHSGLMDHRENKYSRVEQFPETSFTEVIALPAQRSSRSRKTPAKKAPRKNRNASKVLHPLVNVESVFKGPVRKRSCLSKPSRSSTWGLLGSVTRSFEESNGLQIHQVCEGQNEGSQIQRGSQRNGRQKQNGDGGNSHGSKGPSTNHIRLKVKFGKEFDKTLLLTKAPEVVDTSISANSNQIVNVVEDNWRQEGTIRTRRHTNKKLEKDETCEDGDPATKDLECVSVTENSAEDEIQNCVEVPAHAFAVSSGGSVGNSYSNPETSPDSEVINLIPEAHEAMPQEACHGNCVKKDGSLPSCPASTMEAKPSKCDGCRQHGFPPCAEALSNSSGDKQSPVEPMYLSGGSDHGVPGEALYVDRSAEAETDLQVTGLHCSKNMLPSSNSKGQKPPKGKSSGSNSAIKRNGTRKPRENKQKSANKRKVKEDKQLISKVESLSNSGDLLGDSNSSHVVECIGFSNMDAVPVDLDKQYIPRRNAWVLCDACEKWRHIPVELADFIDETKCTWTCKENQDRNFNDCSIPQEKSNAEINAELEISDASGDDASGTQLRYKTLECRRPAVSQQNVASIKTNQFLHRNRKNQSIDEIMVCHCKPPKEDQLGCGEDCLNRMLNIECVRGTCPCGDLCSNQQFQKRRYSKLEKFRCGKKGFGLRSLEKIRKGKFLIEYVGEVLDTHAYEARLKEYAVNGHRHFYFMTLNTSEVIDACAKGNLGRFINHSCDPNCRTEKWMVNGEVCIGLFAFRDIMKGEEVTFDYNFVRVIGAAAKKCHCGSTQCQGYIGGDPLNTDIILQDDSDDEYVEPVMIPEDVVAENGRDNAGARPYQSDNLDGVIIQCEESASASKEIDNSISAGKLEISTQRKESDNRYPLELQHPLPAFVQPVEVVKQTEDLSSKFAPAVQQEVFREMGAAERSSNPSEKPVNTSPIQLVTKPLSDHSDDIDANNSKVQHSVKISHPSSFIKKVKVRRGTPLNTNKIQVVAKSHLLPFRHKRSIDGSVEEKLNELLDTDGGISKSKDSAKGYLKLLFLTAQSGDSGSREAIKSNRDLSIILDALLKTKSRTVLIDIINKNGLRMLHNIMKMCRRDFNKIPILRKLLKVLEYLAEKPQILTQEHITGGPPCPGMESFTESILSLTEHADKRVHDIARNFRNRWIPKGFRRHCFVDKDDGKMDFNRISVYNRFSPNDNRHDQTGRSTEVADSPKQSVVKSSPAASIVTQDGIPTPSTERNVRKRKSRWDQPAVTGLDSRSRWDQPAAPGLDSTTYPHKEPKIEFKQLESSVLPQIGDVTSRLESHSREGGSCLSTGHHIGHQVGDDDAPPGFSSCLNTPAVSYWSTSSAIGHPQAKFVSRLPVSYSIPLSIMQQYGTPHSEAAETWVVAPGMPFHPFPPLPPCLRHKKDPSEDVSRASVNQASEGQQTSCDSTYCHSKESTPSTAGGTQADFGTPSAENLSGTKRERESLNEAPLGRRYFKQQKWNHQKLGPPWLRDRTGW